MRYTSSHPRGRQARLHGLVAMGTSLVLLPVLALAGCSSSTSAAGSASSGAPVELTMMNHSRGSEATLNALAKAYTEQTGVKVTIDTPGPTDYIAKLQAKAQSKNMPDLFTAVGASDMAPYYKAGWALNLQSEMDAGWAKSFTPAVVSLSAWKDGNNLSVPAGTYAAYWDQSSYGLFYDPAKSGLAADASPATMSDLITSLAGSGKGNFSVAASLTPFLLQSYASNYMTDQQIDDTFAGKASWKTDAWRKTFQLLLDLKKAGVVANNTLPGGGSDNADVEKSFFNARTVGAIFDGSFAAAVAKTTAPDFTSYASTVLPPAADATQKARIIAIAGKGAVVNAKGPHVKEALAFLKWLTAPAQQETFMKSSGSIPTNPDLLGSGKINAQLAGFAKAINSGSAEIVSSQLTAGVSTAIQRGSQSLVLGEKTIDQVLDDVQTAQDRSK